jgi:FKBP-type peptidyl-prolyl cis-trans isomerase 2/predicted Fe-Mo cluster-binding NifX family protein
VLIAVPSDTTDGLDAVISEHFGHCAAFTLVAVDDGAIGDVTVVPNGGHEQGGCMAPVTMLKEQGVDVLVAGGMGQRPLSGFHQVGIAVHFKEEAATVREAIQLHIDGRTRSFGDDHTCGGGEGHCGSHHHDEPEVVPIEGRRNVCEGRLITLEFELRDADGTVLDSSAKSGPMRFMYGGGQMLPALERAIADLEPGGHVVTDVPMADAFGERDERRVVEAPREQLPPDATVGAVVTAQDEQGRQFPLLITHLDDRIARMDGNHPFAGRDLVFDLTVKDVQGLKTN